MSEAEAKTGAEITGHVSDEKGRPISGGRVSCNGVEARTLFNGSYLLRNVAPGTYNVEVVLEGYRKQRKTIQVIEDKSVNVDFNLEVETGDAKIYGYVLDKATEAPLRAGGSVYMLRPTSNVKTLINPENGYFEFTNLPSGQYQIWTSILEYEDEKKVVVIDDGEDRREDFHIRKMDIEPPLG
jgi:hypothetical protein